MTLSTVQYLVAEDGQRVGVVLSWEDYLNLQSRSTGDPDLLPGMGEAELRVLAEGMLSPRHQQRLGDLLDRNRQGDITEEERQELDALLEQIDDLNALKARAQYTLKQRAQAG